MSLIRPILVVALVISAVATAQPAEPERPWAKGVSPVKQKQALELFRQGNASLKESQWRIAADRYREALALWDHPAINYNLALALLQLDQPIETSERLEASLKYGPAPLDADKYEQAQRYKALVEKQVARVELSCDVEGAAVKLNGQQVFVGPGQYKALVRAGPITVVAAKDGFLTNEQSPVLLGGETKRLELTLVAAEQALEYRRLFGAWIPWTVLGAGVALAGGGLGLHLSARNQFSVFDTGIEGCTDPRTGGCVPSLDLAATRTQGQGQQATAMVLYGVGGAAIVTGAILLYVNRLQPYRADVKLESALRLLPSVGPNGAGVTLLLDL
jgi:tetratricopeptide (TPR) repeat protein